MTVFISHSFENKDQFDNIADALSAAGVPYWNPDNVKPGSSLRDQLRHAVDGCSVCVFVATHRALESSWCGAELGAFWGAGKPIIVYLADTTLKEEALPPIVQGDVREGKIKRIVERAGELVTEAASATDETTPLGSRHVGNMTVDELERLIAGAVSLAAASTKSGPSGATPEEIGRVAKGAADSVVEGIRATKRTEQAATESRWKHILWVDDRPNNNIYERRAFESLGFKFTLALSTDEALRIFSQERFAAIISDMGRKEGPREGYVLLDTLRQKGDQTPFFIYASSNAPEHKRETLMHGGHGCTNNPSELLEMVTGTLATPPAL